jgi:hypothetical protein
MTARAVTAWVLVAAALALALYDVGAFLAAGVEATISRSLYEWAQRWPIIPFALGVLTGHLFWSQHGLKGKG